MNERMTELYAKACLYARDKHFEDKDVPAFIQCMSEKLAELIVLECVNAVMDGTKEGDHYAMRIEQHFDKSQGGILHFGVEE